MNHQTCPKENGPNSVTASNSSNKAFSLVELSIVLIIIGLLVAGVVAGSKLITQTKLRALANQINDLEKAKITFITIYEKLPGDMDNAASYWSDCTDSSTNTCNGDGDGLIEGFNNNVKGEDVRFLEHLKHAEILTGNFTGRKGSSNIYELDSSAITAKWSGGAIIHRYHGAYSKAYNGFQLGALNGAVPSFKAAISSQNAYLLDNKYDDGLANQGDIISQVGSGASGCTSSNAYVKSQTTIKCRMWWHWKPEMI